MSPKWGRLFRRKSHLRETRRAARNTIESLEGRILLATRYVDVNAPGPTHDGTTWDTAYVDLQEALAGAVSGDEIRAADGVYKPTSGTDRTVSFQLITGVSVLGGYSGSGAADPDLRDPSLYESVLSGDIGAVGDASDNSYHVVNGSGVTTSAVLEGFTITHGNANGETTATNRGGGLFVWPGTPTIRDCKLVGNSAGYARGGAFTNDDGMSLSRCLFLRNSAGHLGGAAYSTATLALYDCALYANTAVSGGGLYGTRMQLRNCIFVANSASSGGGIYIRGVLNAGNCTIVSNFGYPGPGLYLDFRVPGGLLPMLANCIFWGNGYQPWDAQAYISGSFIRADYCDFQGGLEITGVGNIDVDPLFIRAPNPGTDNLWGTDDDDYGDLRVTAISPVVDAGTNFAVAPGAPTDAAGNPRFTDIATAPDTGAGTAPIVDIGAYEAEPALMARAGGPYTVLEGASITLTGRGASTVAGALQYDWEWDGDSQFDEATGPSATFDSTPYSAGTILNLILRVTDSAGQTNNEVTAIRIVPRVIYVDDDAPGAEDGSSWENAFTELSVALPQAIPGQLIKVAGGSYKPTSGMYPAVPFELKSGVALLGGHAGYGYPDPDARNLSSHPSTLSGDIGIAGDSSDNSHQVLMAIEVDSTATLDGFVVTGGNAPVVVGRAGGGIYLAGRADPLIRNCTFVANSAASGGALYNLGSPIIVNCAFVGNAANSGGAIYNRGSPTFINCSLAGNQATGNGAAIRNFGGVAVLINCIVWGNTSPSGTQIYADSGSSVVSYSNVQGGFAGIGNVDADPQFVRPPDPGPDSIWGTADDDYGDLRVLPGSPCIDTGSSSAVPDEITTDLLGHDRLSDVVGVNDPGTNVDMGSYEADGVWGVVGSLDHNALQQAAKMRFSRNILQTSLSSDDLTITRLGVSDPTNYALLATVSYDPATFIARWTFSPPMPDGNYYVTLPAASVSDAADNPLSTTYTFDFFVLAADANRDRRVDVLDLVILANNWLGTGKTFSQGDFNYDGVVNQSDLGIMATRWQVRVDPPAVPSPASPASSPIPTRSRTPTRVTSTGARSLLVRDGGRLSTALGLGSTGPTS